MRDGGMANARIVHRWSPYLPLARIHALGCLSPWQVIALGVLVDGGTSVFKAAKFCDVPGRPV